MRLQVIEQEKFIQHSDDIATNKNAIAEYEFTVSKNQIIIYVYNKSFQECLDGVKQHIESNVLNIKDRFFKNSKVDN